MLSASQQVATRGLGHVDLISQPATTPSGLSRYADTLALHLRLEGIHFRARQTAMPGLLRPFAALSRAAGWDLPTFFQNYPVGGQLSGSSLYHLASENLASLLAFQRPSPSVVTVHGFFGYLLRNDPELNMHAHLVHRAFDSLVVRGLRRAEHLICVSEYLKDVMVAQLAIHPTRITVVPEAVDHSIFYPAHVDDSFYTRFGLSRQHRYVLYVGSEQPRKNFLTLLRAFAKVREHRPELRLLKVGRPEYAGERQKALSLIEELGLADSVIFVGHIADELPDFYRVADLFAFPSRYEGFGFPPLEAMACGAPVVCSNTTSLPEVVGDAALLFDPLNEAQLAAALERLLSDEALRDRLIHLGLANARRFQWERTARQTAEVYRLVTGDGRVRPNS